MGHPAGEGRPTPDEYGRSPGYGGGPVRYDPQYVHPNYPPAGYVRSSYPRYSGYGGYGQGYGTGNGPRHIPRPLPVPKQPTGTGVRGVFLVLTIVAMVLAGTVGLRHGLTGLGLLSPEASSSSYPSAPIDVRPVSGPLTRDDAVALERAVSPGIVDITAQLTSQHAVGAGTGIVLSSSGQILTNNHVIRGASSIKVTSVTSGRSFPATVIGYDQKHDIAVLQARGATGLRPAKLGDSDTVQIGDQVAAIGNAGGKGGRPSVATGPVTDLNRTIRTSDELTGSTERLTGLIEANADIQPGDSGGPMVNTAGEVIGVDVAASVDARSQEPNGTGFAIPINNAMAVARQIQGGSPTEAVHVGETGLLGVTVTGLSDRAMRDAAAEFGISSRGSVTGAFVAGVLFDSPAGQAGLRPGDVITAVNGTPVDSASALTSTIGAHRPGDRLLVSWTEPSGQPKTATVALASGPPS